MFKTVDLKFAAKKAKICALGDVPGYVRGILPHRGLVFKLFGFDIDFGTASGEIIVDIDKGTLKYNLATERLKYNLASKPGRKEGAVKLSSAHLTEITLLANYLWESTSDYKSVNIPSRLMVANLVLVDCDKYRIYDFNGFLEGEVNKLFNLLLRLIFE